MGGMGRKRGKGRGVVSRDVGRGRAEPHCEVKTLYLPTVHVNEISPFLSAHFLAATRTHPHTYRRHKACSSTGRWRWLGRGPCAVNVSRHASTVDCLRRPWCSPPPCAAFATAVMSCEMGSRGGGSRASSRTVPWSWASCVPRPAAWLRRSAACATAAPPGEFHRELRSTSSLPELIVVSGGAPGVRGVPISERGVPRSERGVPMCRCAPITDERRRCVRRCD